MISGRYQIFGMHLVHTTLQLLILKLKPSNIQKEQHNWCKLTDIDN